jgi:transposase
MVAPRTLEGWLSEQRKYRQFTPDQKAEIVLAGLRGDRSCS